MSQTLSYIQEFRRRLFYCLGFWLCLFLPCLYYSNTLYQALAQPLLALLPPGSHLIATQISAPFTAPLRLAWYLSLLAGLPLWAYQLWAFIIPALYPPERKLALPLTFCSLTLFYLGLAVAFWGVCPLALRFFVWTTPPSVALLADVHEYLNFIFSLLLGFGLAFQTPVITWLLLHAKIFSVAQLRAFRPYMIILAFVLGMLLTPPDVFSQILLALPLWGLFELGLLLSQWTLSKPN